MKMRIMKQMLYGEGQGLRLRVRVALFSGALLVTLSLGLVLFINVMARVTVPYTESAMLPLPASSPRWVPGDPTPEPSTLGGESVRMLNVSKTTVIRQNLLGQLRGISLLSLALVCIVGTLGAYWLAGWALQPITRLSRAVERITASTLHVRTAQNNPEDELEQLTKSFDALLGRLEHSFRQQGQFMANAAHELRTPLTTLRANVEMLYYDPDATAEDYRSMAPVLQKSLMRLEQLVADLLVMAKEEKSLCYAEITLQPLVEEVLSDLELVASEMEVALLYRGDPTLVVLGDARLLARVFSNLVENGIRYNRPGGTVKVHAFRNENQAVVVVTDTGMGIPTSQQSNIFDRFHRLGHSQGHTRGAGLGLSITKHIVRLHGGDIYVESTLGRGSKFIVQLPMLVDVALVERHLAR